MHSDIPRSEVPVLHVSHAVWPLAFAKRPSAQSVHVSTSIAPDVVLCFPGAHELHLAAASTPVADEYFPAAQAVQVALLVALMVLLHKPAGHNVHEVRSAFAKLPGLHLEHLISPPAEIVPSAHGVHIGGSLNESSTVPALQSVQ